MKITRKQLIKIIKEEVELSSSDKIRIVDDAKRTLDQIGGVHKDARHFASLMRRSAYDAMRSPSDDEARTSAGAAMRASGGQGAAAIPIEAILDALSDAGIVELDTPGSDNGIVNSNLIKKESGSSPRVSESKMKITRKQLRQIIKEEARALQEQEGEESSGSIPWDKIDEGMVKLGGMHLGTRAGSDGEIRMYMMPTWEKGDKHVIGQLKRTGAWDMGVRKFRSTDQTGRRIGRNTWDLQGSLVQIGKNISGSDEG
jgi:hypothetical protein